MLKEYDKIKEEIMTKRLNQFILRFLSIYKTMSYCFKCRKITESKNPKIVKTTNGRIMLLPKW